MNINTNMVVSMTEANQNFSKVAKLVDEKGIAVIVKNNAPRYVVIEFKQLEEEKLASNEDILTLSNRFMDKNRKAYLELAK
ncbi:MAG: type II toxin-antitoxin system Phd/YefM family antitoxin [Christensenellales bacterium]|jgi:antitoxin Phd|nr:type II toxin-antitoxin system Phd/YefM family antitoxin [Clostridiales bacterium]